MSDDLVNNLRAYGIMFEKPNENTFLQATGASRDWPNNRGIYLSDCGKFCIWVNEEDHMRIISIEDGGDIVSIFKRLSKGIHIVEQMLAKMGSGYQLDKHFGYVLSCPSNLGTGMRASVLMKLPMLSH